LVEKAGKKYKIHFENDWHKYPSTATEFNDEEKSYNAKFNKIKGKVKTNIDNDKKFSESILKMLMDKDNYGTANSKLMQVEFLYQLVKLPKKDMEGFITDLFFLAEKRGQGFGPFGKLY